METKPASILRRGGEGGVIMGAWFVVLFAVMVAGASGGFLSMLAFAMIVVTPFVAYRLLRRGFVAAGGAMTFSAVWFEGILMFIGGSLFLAVAAFLFFRIIDPMFLSRQLGEISELYLSSDAPSLKDFGATLRSMIDHNMIPRPIEVAISLAWLGAFTGSILSMILAAIVKAVGLRSNPKL